jgi:hypothetical protein
LLAIVGVEAKLQGSTRSSGIAIIIRAIPATVIKVWVNVVDVERGTDVLAMHGK